MRFTVYFHPLAQADYDQIFNYIENRSPQGARSWDISLDHAIAKLKSDPMRYGRIPERIVSELEYNQLSFRTTYGKRYRLIYTIDGDTVTVLRIRGPGQANVTPNDMPNE